MSEQDQDPPVADDDFPEFAEPPRHRPVHSAPAAESSTTDEDDGVQGDVDAVLARLRREREQGRR